MADLDLSVVIVNFNALAYLRRCLASLPAGAADLRWEAIVVDNASREPGVEALADERGRVRVIRRRVNGGFAAGANTGIEAARAGVVALLNPDTVVHPGALAILLDYLRANPDVGVVGPRIENPDGSLQLSCRRFPTLWAGLFNRYSLLTRLLPSNRLSASYLMTDWDHATTRDVDWLSGAAMMIPRQTFAQVGRFDEGYFFALEDVDFCRRVHAAGLRVVYVPEAVVTHHIGGSSATVPARAVVARHRGMWRYYRRYLRGDTLGPCSVPGVPLLLDGAVAAAVVGRCALQLALISAVRAPGLARRQPSRLLARRRMGP